MTVGSLGNKSPDSNRFIPVAPKSENDVRLQATLGNQNPTGKPMGAVSGYFYYNAHEPCWELKFVGERFKDILDGDCVAVFKMLRAAYDTLEEWVKNKDDE